jgi:hypothetical protein
LNADLIGDFSTLDEGRLDGSLRTSLITDPPNGLIPLTSLAKARQEVRSKARKLPPDGPEAVAPERTVPSRRGGPAAASHLVQQLHPDRPDV